MKETNLPTIFKTNKQKATGIVDPESYGMLTRVLVLKNWNLNRSVPEFRGIFSSIYLTKI